jgi:hypothetical protein
LIDEFHKQVSRHLKNNIFEFHVKHAATGGKIKIISEASIKNYHRLRNVFGE